MARRRKAPTPEPGPQDPLTPREIQQVERLFSDPFVYPSIFKNWLRAYLIENVAITEMAGGSGLLPGGGDGGGLPVGGGCLWFTPTAPANFLSIDGAVVSRTTYKAIFDIFGTQYGVGDGSTTFGLPNLGGRVPVGKGTHADVDVVGDNEGAAAGDRRPKHKHGPASITTTAGEGTHTHGGSTGNAGGHSHGGSTGSVGDHQHAVTIPDMFGIIEGTAGGVVNVAQAAGSSTGAAGGHSHSISTDSESDHAHSLAINSTGSPHQHTASVTVGPTANAPTDGPAFLTVLYIIRYA